MEGRRGHRWNGAEERRVQGSTLKVGEVSGGGALDAMVAAALEEGVPQVAEVGDNALQLRLAQHAQVPLAQVLAARRLLPARVAVQDVVITLHISAHP